MIQYNTSPLSKGITWLMQLVAAALMFQTLFFKFTGAPESVYIFNTLGMEPTGRIATGGMELIACILLLIRRAAWVGALLAAGTMTGAIFFHVTVLGIEVMDDNGLLFYMAGCVLVASVAVLIIRRHEIIFLNKLINIFPSRK